MSTPKRTPNAASAALGECVRTSRKAKGVPLTELAKIMGVPGTTMADFETGRRPLTLAQVRKLAAVLEFDVGSLEGLQWMLPRDACRMLGISDAGLRFLDDRLLPQRQGQSSHRRYDYTSVKKLVDARVAEDKIINARKSDPRFEWLYVMFQRAKQRARGKGIPFDNECPALECPDVCPVLTIPLAYWAKRGVVGPDSPTLDRIIPARGYVASNLRVISHRANTLKRDATVEEMRLVLADLERLSRTADMPARVLSWLPTRSSS